MDSEKCQELIDEIGKIADTEGIDPSEAVELIQIKLASFLAQNPEDAVELSQMRDSDFMQRRVAQLLSEIVGDTHGSH